MEFYYEYPIRCKCNQQVAAYAPLFKRLSEKMSIEAALDQIGFKRYCCRISMMNPVYSGFDNENRLLIQGYNLSVTDVEQTSTTPQGKTTKSAPEIIDNTGFLIEDLEDLGEGLDIDQESEFFYVPTTLGVPTINTDPTIPGIQDAETGIPWVSGRTYLAV